MKNARYSSFNLPVYNILLILASVLYCFLFIFISIGYGNTIHGHNGSNNHKQLYNGHDKWEFDGLKHRLIADGFSKAEIKKIFNNPNVFFSPKGVSLFFVHSESKLNYNQFLSQKSINSAALYMKKYKKALDEAQSKYGVDKTIITAIMLVETRFGAYLGKRPVINTLSTMASLSDKKVREHLWHFINRHGRLSKRKFNRKAAAKSKWAYYELKALIKYCMREHIDPAGIRGSYAGAMGIAQFMPSKALSLAKDGNGDGRVDLFNHCDAIYSIANYLKHFGWKPSTKGKAAYKILYKYNHSNYYVDTLLKISDRLKG